MYGEWREKNLDFGDQLWSSSEDKYSEDRLPIERDCPYFPEFKFAKLSLCLGEDANLVNELDESKRRHASQFCSSLDENPFPSIGTYGS